MKVQMKSFAIGDYEAMSQITGDSDSLSVQTGEAELAQYGLDAQGNKHIGLLSRKFLMSLENETYTSIIPLTLAVSSSTQTAKGGVRRVMIRAELGYQALSPDSSVSSLANGFDPTRSGKKITFHVVATLPKEVAQDLSGANGAPCANVAAAQVDLVRKILVAALLDGKAAMVNVRVESSQSGNETKPVSLGWSSDNVKAQMLANGYNGNTVTYAFEGGCAPMFTNDINDPIRRGVAGLEPIPASRTISIQEGVLSLDPTVV